MSSDQRTSTVSSSLRPAHAAAVAFCLSLAGCSADVTRFDGPSFSLTEEKAPAAQPPAYRQGTSDPATTPYRRSGLTGEGTAGVPPPSNRVASLPPANPGYSAQPLPAPTVAPPAERAPPQAERRMPRATASGESIEVQQGDTLFGLSRRHHVPVSALIEVNNLGANSAIKPGQKLLLPSGSHAASAEPTRTASAKIPAARPQATDPIAQAPAVANWEGRHTLRSGESVYAIARHYKVPASELQRVNGITDPARVRMGTVLRVPSAKPGAIPAYEADPAPRMAQQPADPATPPGVVPGVRVLNAPERKAALPDRANDADPVAAADPVTPAATRFRWPARGKVIGTFGKRPDGSSNEGIKIQLPMGSDIHAVEGGRVLYASSEIQQYGNLVLIQHENGWVSAYGHADRLLVKRDDVVKKGQIIGKVGRTGVADQPQLHFELRQGSKPMDPIAYLDK